MSRKRIQYYGNIEGGYHCKGHHSEQRHSYDTVDSQTYFAVSRQMPLNRRVFHIALLLQIFPSRKPTRQVHYWHVVCKKQKSALGKNSIQFPSIQLILMTNLYLKTISGNCALYFFFPCHPEIHFHHYRFNCYCIFIN